MADTIKEAQVKITATDQTKAGTDQVKRNLKGVGQAAQQTQQKMQGFVSEQTGRNLSQFNEKTEKGRQLLNAFGGAVGGAAGEVVYYSGTLSYVIGRFSAMELAAMGALAVIGGLAWAFTRASEEQEQAAKFADHYAKQNKKLRDELDGVIRSNQDQMEGYDAIGKKVKELTHLTDNYKIALDNAKEAAKAYDLGAGSIAGQERLDAAVARSQKLFDDTEALRKKALAAMERFRLFQMDLEIKRQKAQEEQQRKLKEVLERQQAKARQERDDSELFNAMKADEKREQDRLAKAEQERRNALVANIDFTLAKRQNEIALIDAMERDQDERDKQRAQEAFEREQYYAELKHDIAMSSIELVGIIAEAIGESSRAGLAFRVAAIVGEAAYLAAIETAKGFAALANPFGGQLQAAAHFLAAAKFAAVGAVKLAGIAGGGGGGGASYGAGSQARGTTPMRQDEKPEREKVIIYVSGHMINTKPEYDSVFADGVQRYQESQNPGQEQGSF